MLQLESILNVSQKINNGSHFLSIGVMPFDDLHNLRQFDY
jgi:hypothetical protein